MIFKNTVGHAILSFEPSKFVEVVEGLLESGIVLTYTSHNSPNYSITNNDFEEYLKYKNLLYLSKGIKTQEDSFYSFSYDQSVYSPTIFNYLSEKYERRDDYFVATDILSDSNITGVILKHHKVRLIEEELRDLAYSVDKKYYDLTYSYFTDEHHYNQCERFMLLPVRIKHNNKYLLSYVMITIHKVGVIVLQICIQEFLEKRIKISDSSPTSKIYDEVYFYPSLKYVAFDDLWRKEEFKDFTLNNLLDEYSKRISIASGERVSPKPLYNSFSYGIADFTHFKEPYVSYKDFYNRYNSLFYQQLNNTDKNLLQRLEPDFINLKLEESLIRKDGDLEFYSNKSSSLLTVRSKLFLDLCIEDLKELEGEEGYKELLKNNLGNLFIMTMSEFTIFYELSFVEKYFLKDTIFTVSSNKPTTITEYNQFILSWNNIKFRYDIDSLFLQEGSPKRLYAEIEKQCNLDVLEKK